MKNIIPQEPIQAKELYDDLFIAFSCAVSNVAQVTNNGYTLSCVTDVINELCAKYPNLGFSPEKDFFDINCIISYAETKLSPEKMAEFEKKYPTHYVFFKNAYAFLRELT